MKEQTLLLITDISGFTQFVAQSDPDTGIHQAQEMLQIIVDSNDLGLELCEIEGDAVFFYMRRGMPTFNRLLKQIRQTFSEFQAYLSDHALDDLLGIKFFVHVGECQSLTVGGRTKLFGLDVIMIHRLLKGLVESKNYMLMTKDATDVLDYHGKDAVHGKVDLEHIGLVRYVVLNEQTLRAESIEVQPSESILDQVLLSLQLLSTEFQLSFARLVWPSSDFLRI